MVQKAEGMTNDTPGSVIDVELDCKELWSLAQQFSYLRLGEPSEANQFGEDVQQESDLLEDYEVRARRIAATYARFYLELEDGGDPAKKGRYYWMALGAFASKTVACLLSDIRIDNSIMKTVHENLGKGNFWLFMDIAPWHWFYSHSPDTFDSCRDTRSADNLVPEVQKIINEILPWSSDALSKINQLRSNEFIERGFGYLAKIEQDPNSDEVNDAEGEKMLHLMEIAEHEQGRVLQPLIYKNKDFAWWAEKQRNPIINWLSPPYELVFTSACSTSKPEEKSVAPDDMIVENLRSRMEWITDAAAIFHGRMQDNTSKMESELLTIASWVDKRDPVVYLSHKYGATNPGNQQ
jgi:hypothetical protein